MRRNEAYLTTIATPLASLISGNWGQNVQSY